MEKLRDKILTARPSLSRAAPQTYAICWGYAVVNTLLGVGLFFLYNASPPLTVANIFSYQIWGILFEIAGLLSAYSLLRNYWKAIRAMLMYGLVLKAIWAVALVIRCVADPHTILITVVWLFFAYIQAVVYIYFLPRVPAAER